MRISDWSSDVCSSDLVGRGRPGAAEDLGIGDLEPQGRPAARAVAVEEAARGARVHAIFRLERRDRLGRQRRAPRAVISRIGEFVGAGRDMMVVDYPDTRRSEKRRVGEEVGKTSRYGWLRLVFKKKYK